MKTADSKNMDPRWVKIRRLMILENFTSMPTNLRTAHVLVTPPAPLPHMAFKTPSLKATGELGSFVHELPILLA